MNPERAEAPEELRRELERLRKRDEQYKADQEVCRLTENLLRRSEEKLSLLLDQTPLAYIEWDASLKVKDWNRAAERIFGYERAEVLGKQAFDIIAPRHIRDYAKLVPEQFIKQDASFECVYENVTKSGESINCSWHNTPLRDEQGYVTGMISFVQDITAHRRLDENISQLLLQIKDEEGRLKNIIEKNADGILIVDQADSHIRFANPAAAALFGKKAHELIDRVFGFPLFGNEYEDIEVFNPDRILNVEMRSSQMDWEGRNAWLVTLRDVSGRKDHIIEKETLRLRAQEQALRVSKEAVAAAEESNLWLVRNMRYELSPPLNVILGAVQLALDGELTPEQRALLEHCRDAGLKLLRTVNQVLQLSQLETGGIALQEERFFLRETLDALVKPLAVQAGLQGVACELRVEENTPDELYGDLFRLRQILTTLAANGLRNTREGGVRLKVRLMEKRIAGKDKTASLLFSVQDSGPGLTEEERNTLFADSEQFPEAPRDVGAGLKLCKRLVELMGGAIWVENSPGSGNVFLFNANFGIFEPEQAHEKSKGTRTAPRRPLKILVAEDDRLNQSVLERLLRPHGHSVEIVQNGIEALRALEREDFDLLLLDIQMPLLDGLQLTKRIRQGETKRNQRIPIVALTAYAVAEERQRFINLGMSEFLPKPFDPAQLLKAIDNAAPDSEPTGKPDANIDIQPDVPKPDDEPHTP